MRKVEYHYIVTSQKTTPDGMLRSTSDLGVDDKAAINFANAKRKAGYQTSISMERVVVECEEPDTESLAAKIWLVIWLILVFALTFSTLWLERV